MRCEIIGVGTELLLGQIVNSNAARIGERLADIGWDCLRHTVVGDNEGRIATAVTEALERADAVVITGGLGPTQDDVTREAVAAVAGVALHRDAGIEATLRERFASFSRDFPTMNLRQADVPDGARVLDNPRGTAPGLALEIGGKPVFTIPGPPLEMELMLETHVLPELAGRAGEGRVIISRTLRTVGIGESAVADRLTPLWEAGDGTVNLAYLAGPGEVRVRLTAAAADRDGGLAEIAPVEAAVRAELGDAVYGVDEESLEELCGRLLMEKGLTLAAAESLTGGLLGARITDVPGSSDYFLGSACVYAVEAKTGVLAVPPVLLDAAGPVSEAVAGNLAERAREVFESDVGLGVTGAAGPDGHGGQPPGTVCVGAADAEGTATRRFRAPGQRPQVRRWATTIALDLLRRRLQGLPER